MYGRIIYFTELLIAEYYIWRYLLKKTCQKVERLDVDLVQKNFTLGMHDVKKILTQKKVLGGFILTQ